MTALAVAALSMLIAQSGTLDRIVADRLSGRPDAGVVIGVLENERPTIVQRGRAALDANTPFDVGGLTDVFVAIALADMLGRREVALSDPVGKHLPGVAVPTRGGRSITLEDLVMHRAGLPRVLPGLKRGEATSFRSYTPDRLGEFLAGYELPGDIGGRYARSHVGTALLGAALAARAGVTIERLLEGRVFVPLGMSATTVTDGVLRSTANDLMKFLAAHLHQGGPLAATLEETRASRGNVGAPREALGLGWRIRSAGTRQLLWASGSAGGHQAFMAFDPAARRAAVVLHNEPLSVDDIGFLALEGVRNEPSAGAGESLAPFIGEYEVRRGFVIVVRLDGGKLVARVGAEPESSLTQDSELRFVFDYADARLTFIRDPTGATIGLMLHREGQHIGARKVR